jgi:hypothetical protein
MPRRWLWDILSCCPQAQLAPPILRGNHEVRRREVAIGVPVALGPAGVVIDRVFVLTRLIHVNEMAAVELFVQVGVAKPCG